MNPPIRRIAAASASLAALLLLAVLLLLPAQAPAAPLTQDARYEGLMHANSIAWNSGDHEEAAALAQAALALDVSLGHRMIAAEWAGRSHNRLIHHKEAYEFFRLAFDLVDQRLEQHLSDPDLQDQDREKTTAHAREYGAMVGAFAINAAQRAGQHDDAFELAAIITNDDTYPEERRAQALFDSGQHALDLNLNNRAADAFRDLLKRFRDWGYEHGTRASAGMQLLEARELSLEANDPAAYTMVNTIIDEPRLQGLPSWFWAVNEAADELERRGRWSDSVRLRLWAIERGHDRLAALATLQNDAGLSTLTQSTMSRQYQAMAHTLDRRRQPGMALTAWQSYINNGNNPFNHDRDQAKISIDQLRARGTKPAPFPAPSRVELRPR